MADFQRVVEYLRDVRLPPLAITDELRQYAAQYAELCRAANERLRRCCAFLAQGYRAEARHLAEENPNLLDLVAALDYPESVAWAEFCRSADLPVPESLQMERAAQLNEAYTQDEPLEHLFARLRLLNLARASVVERLSLMRMIAAQDASSFWDGDIRSFERVRLRELPNDFVAAVKAQDFTRIQEIYAELTQQPWREIPPQDLVQAVGEAFQRMQRQAVEQELDNLLPAIHDAFAAKDHALCTSLLQQWKQTADMSPQGIAGSLNEQIRHVVEWVNNENEAQTRCNAFESACQELNQLLASEAPTAELEATLAKIKGFDEGVPEDLQTRYDQRILARQKAGRNRFRLKVAALIGTFLLIGGVIAVVIILQRGNQETQTVADKISAANKALDIALADSIYTDALKVNPGFATAAPVLAAHKETETIRARFQEDKSRLDRTLAELNGALEPTRALLNNSNTTAEKLLSEARNLDSFVTQLNALGDLKWVDPDDRILKSRSELENMRVQLQEQANKNIVARINQVEAEVNALRLDTTTDLSKLELQFGQLRSKVATIKSIVGIEDTQSAKSERLLTAIDTTRKDLALHRERMLALQKVLNATGSPEELKRELEVYIANQPTAKQTGDFKRAVDRALLVKSVEAWRDLVRSWNGKFEGLTAVQAQTRIVEISRYVTAYPATPFMSDITSYGEYLKQSTEATAEQSVWQKDFGDLLANPLVRDIGYIKTSDGVIHLTLGDIKYAEHRLGNTIYYTFEELDTSDVAKRKKVDVIPPMTMMNPKPLPMAHAVIAIKMAEQIRFIDDKNWETWGITMLDEVLASKDSNLFIKALFAQQLMRTSITVTGGAVKDLYEKTLTELARQDPNLQWFALPATAVESLEKALAGIPKSDVALARLAQRKKDLFARLTQDFVGYGVLMKDAASWTVYANDIGKMEGMRIVVLRGTASTTLQNIGTIKAAKPQLDTSLITDLPQGQIVMFFK
ncbi:MAG: hypothetical protein WCJ97_03515 [Phycisphaerae bacterium]